MARTSSLEVSIKTRIDALEPSLACYHACFNCFALYVFVYWLSHIRYHSTTRTLSLEVSTNTHIDCTLNISSICFVCIAYIDCPICISIGWLRLSTWYGIKENNDDDDDDYQSVSFGFYGIILNPNCSSVCCTDSMLSATTRLQQIHNILTCEDAVQLVV